MMIFVFWIGFAIAVAAWANSLGRNAFGWLCLAIIISPLLAGIFLAIAGQNGKVCPKCAEKVRREAAVCKHCGAAFASGEAA